MIKQNNLIALLLSTAFAIPGFSMEKEHINNNDHLITLEPLDKIQPHFIPQPLSEEEHMLIKKTLDEKNFHKFETICTVIEKYDLFKSLRGQEREIEKKICMITGLFKNFMVDQIESVVDLFQKIGGIFDDLNYMNYFFHKLRNVKYKVIKKSIEALKKYPDFFLNKRPDEAINLFTSLSDRGQYFTDEYFELLVHNIYVLRNKETILDLLLNPLISILWEALSDKNSEDKAEDVAIFLDEIKEAGWLYNNLYDDLKEQEKMVYAFMKYFPSTKILSFPHLYRHLLIPKISGGEMRAILRAFSEKSIEAIEDSFNIAQKWKTFEKITDPSQQVDLIEMLSDLKDPKSKEAAVRLLNVLNPYFSNVKDFSSILHNTGLNNRSIIQDFELLTQIDCYDLLLSDKMSLSEISKVLHFIIDQELDSDKIRAILKIRAQFKDFPKFLKKDQAFHFLLRLIKIEKKKQIDFIQKVKLFLDKFPDMDTDTFETTLPFLSDHVNSVQTLQYALNLPDGNVFNKMPHKYRNRDIILRLAFAQMENIEKINNLFKIVDEFAHLIPFEVDPKSYFFLLEDTKGLNSLKTAFSLPPLKNLKHPNPQFIALAFSCLETKEEMLNVHEKIEKFSAKLFPRENIPGAVQGKLIHLMCLLSTKFPLSTWGSLNDLFIEALKDSDPKFIASIYPGLSDYIETANIPEESLLFQLLAATQFRLETKDNYDNPFKVYGKLIEERKKEIDFNQIRCHTDLISGYEVTLCPEFISQTLFKKLTLEDLPKSHNLLFDFYEKTMDLIQESIDFCFQDISRIKDLKKYLQLTEDELRGKAPLSDLKVKFMQIIDYFYNNKEIKSDDLIHALKQIKGCPAGTSMGINDIYAQMHLGLSASGLATDYEQDILGVCREIFAFVINSGTNRFYKQLCQVKKIKKTEKGQFIVEDGEFERQDGEAVQGAHGVTYIRNLLGLNNPIQMDWYTRGLSYFLLESTKKDVLDLLFQEHLTPKYFIENFRFFFSLLKNRHDIQQAYIKLGLFSHEEYWDCKWGQNEDGEEDIITSRISDLAILRILNHLGVLKMHKISDLNNRSLINPWN